MTEIASETPKPPRFFLRRFAALIVDLLAYSVLFTFLVAALALALPSLKPGLSSSFLYSRTCSDEGTGLPVFAEIERDWPSSEAASLPLKRQLCTVDSFFLPQKRMAVVSEERAGENEETLRRFVSVQIDENNQPIFPSPLISRGVTTVQLLLLPLAFGIFSALFGRTPGKQLLGLTATRKPYEKHPQPLEPVAAILREYLKFWPVWVNGCFQFAIALQSPSINSVADAVSAMETAGADQRMLVHMLVLNAATLLVIFVWWVWPFALWRGRSLYDAMMRCWVVQRS